MCDTIVEGAIYIVAYVNVPLELAVYNLYPRSGVPVVDLISISSDAEKD